MLPLKDKRITAEVCVHHLHFTSDDYAQYGNLIKCNPAIKAPHNKTALWEALLDDRLDVIATDHAPHLIEEKVPNNKAFRESWPLWEGKAAPIGGGLEGAAGIPLVQHSLLLMLHYWQKGKISLETIVRKMSHAVADCFQIKDRGYIREGYYADLVIVDLKENTTVTKENILFKCGWSPFEGQTFPAAITHTFVSGNLVYGNGQWNESIKGKRLLFNR
jgi:dihydroorotase